MYNIFPRTIVACCFLGIVTCTGVIDTDCLQEQLASSLGMGNRIRGAQEALKF